MGVLRYLGSIVSAHQKSKNRNKPKKSEKKTNKISKEQSLKWSEQGLCYNCGAESGEYEGICDPCRWP